MVKEKNKRIKGNLKKIILLAAFILLVLNTAASVPVPGISVEVADADTPEQTALSIQILVILTVLTLAPAILVMTTSFTRLIVVFSFLRNALGTQQMPPNQILISLALIITLFIMAPIFNKINSDALQPYLEQQISQDEAFEKAVAPVRVFMFKQVREKDLALFVRLAKIERPKTKDDIPTYVVVPAFVISELKKAFQIGFLLFLPFLIIDMVVASILMSMGMMMLPPIMISLPFKILLFVLIDGWNLLVGSLIRGFY